MPTNFKPYFFIDDQTDINESLNIFQENYNHIRNLYLLISSTRGSKYSKDEKIMYPFISKNRIKDFLDDLELLAETGDHELDCSECIKDYKNPGIDKITISALDDIFEATNVEYEMDDENPDDLLIRIELVEFIMRVAQVQNNKLIQLQCHNHS